MLLSKLGRYLKKRGVGDRSSSEDLLNRLRKKGAVIGKDVFVYATHNTVIDETCAYLLRIGNHVRITEGVRILTHDYSWSVLKHYSSDNIRPGAILGAQRPVDIGNCVFIGMNAIILSGTKIGDYVIIGAGSVVTGDCPSGGVYAGNPARRIADISSYYEKRRDFQFSEARTVALCYRDRFGKMPPIEIFDEYFMLFCNRQQALANPKFRKKMELLMNYEETLDYMDQNPPLFSDFEAFLTACFEKVDAK